MSGPRIASLVVAALVAIASGCGDDETTTAAAGTTATSTTTVTETAADESTSPTGETTIADGAVPHADQTVTELTGFTSPSGNIGCFIDRKSVRCDIREREWEPPAPPPDCQLDYGQGISLPAGGAAEFVCAGDTTLDAGPPLEYGRSIAAGLLRCESEESGMSCRDVETGRGFTLSTEGYELS